MINHDPSHVGRKKDTELRSTNKEVIGAHVDPPKLNFSTDYISARTPSDLRAPSADRRETLPRDRNMGSLYNASPKIRGALPQRNWGPKTCKIRRDFRQLQSSIANISGTGQDIQNRKEICSPMIPPAFHEESSVNFGPQSTENWM